MVSQPSDDFLLLAATVIAQLAADSAPDERALLQLQSIFGSMLVSALQLMDRREDLSSNRKESLAGLFAPGSLVTSSTGFPYTLHLALPSIPLPSPPNQVPPTGREGDEDVPAPPRDTALSDPNGEAPTDHQQSSKATETRQEYIFRLADSLKGMFCPCTGFAFNSLAGERNFFCKHLLAVLLSHQMGNTVETRVHMFDMVALLGMNRDGEKVKVEADPQIQPSRAEIKAENVS